MFFRSASPTDPRYFPMLIIEDESAGAAALVDVWNRYKTLPPEAKNILVSDELPRQLKSLQEKFDLKMESLGKITLLVRGIFFGEVKLTELEGMIASMLTATSEGDPNQAKAIVEFIQKEILTIKPKVKAEEASEEEKKRVAATVRLPLLQALSQYEQLGNQLITRERIKIKSQSEPVRPSLLYWIKYYRDELGVGHHDSVQRGNFLFRSENGKRLSPEERERVNLVLKSVEEGFPVEIDTEQSVILFPAFIPQAPRLVPQAAPAPQRAMPQNRGTNFSFGGATSNVSKATPAQAGTLSFSSKHVLPAEKAEQVPPEERTAPEPQSMSPRMVPRAPLPKANPFHIRPVSLRQEEE